MQQRMLIRVRVSHAIKTESEKRQRKLAMDSPLRRLRKTETIGPNVAGETPRQEREKREESQPSRDNQQQQQPAEPHKPTKLRATTTHTRHTKYPAMLARKRVSLLEFPSAKAALVQSSAKLARATNRKRKQNRCESSRARKQPWYNQARDW